MPMFDFKCQFCGARRRVWRYADQPPKYCSKECVQRAWAGRSRKKSIYPEITPEMAEQIHRLYLSPTGSGEVKALAEKLRIPRWKLTRYARNQGWLPTYKGSAHWSQEEIDILDRYAYLSPPRIQVRLRQAGFRRSETSIVIKRKRMNLMANLDGQTCSSLSKCFGVNQKTVAYWIGKGWLKARRRGSARTPEQGGDIYYIVDRAVRKFVKDHPHLVDLRKVDKEWFIDLLTNRL